MAGRIRDEDVAAVRERARIDEIIRDYVTLRGGGGGSLSGLCPFHEEKTPSFHVTPAKSVYYCFGCGKGGDVIDFVMEVEHLSFAEAVERLADKVGLQLRYEESSTGGMPSRNREQRTRLIDAHRAAAEYYATALASPDAIAGRQFLDARGFDRDSAAHFSVGYAPRDGESLLRHLRGRGFSDDELVTGGLVGRRGSDGKPYDRFRGRLLWPIRDLMGDVVGFGARRLFDDDRVEAKYLNTSETPIYKKSQLLYGLDLAKREIAARRQVVVVEGYTDVMACHLAGVPTAVATCGTAFGDEHTRVLRRLLADHDQLRGEVVFTFDGDAAGQKAAMRAFEGDQQWVAQTFVAVEPNGLDPCDLRLQHGDDAVRSLVEGRQRLVEFAVQTMLHEFDLDSAEGRTQALDRTIPIVARIRDASLRDEYARRLAGWVGAADEAVVLRRARAGAGRRNAEVQPAQAAASGADHGDVHPAVLKLEREALKSAVQRPDLAGAFFDELQDDAFLSQVHRELHWAVAAAGGCKAAPEGPAWMQAVAERCPDDSHRRLLTQLAVESVASTPEQLPRYVDGVIARLHEAWVARRLVSVKAQLLRTDPADATYGAVFGELMSLEQRRRELRDRAIGGA